MDRRGHERYSLLAELRFLWKGSGDASYSARGLARDISAGGIFIFSDELPPNGANLRIEVFIGSIFAGSRLVIEAKGQVIRVDVKRGRGFAVAIDTLALRNEKGEIVS